MLSVTRSKYQFRQNFMPYMHMVSPDVAECQPELKAENEKWI